MYVPFVSFGVVYDCVVATRFVVEGYEPLNHSYVNGAVPVGLTVSVVEVLRARV